MSQSFSTITKDGAIAIVAINHAPANALSSACIADLRATFKQLGADDTVHAIIVTGEGRFFVAGADIKEFVEAFGNEQAAHEMAKAGQALCDEIEALTKPVIAAINGPALGGGLELALGCHYRIASQKAILGLPELKLGLLPTFGGTQRLTHITSKAKAIELILTSKQLSPKEAQTLGIVQVVTPPEELMSTARATAQSFIENKSMTSISRTIECIMQGTDLSLREGLALESKRFAELFTTEDAQEGVQAFIEKREAKFNNR